MNRQLFEIIFQCISYALHRGRPGSCGENQLRKKVLFVNPGVTGLNLVHACMMGDLANALEAQKQVAPLTRLIYNFGGPGIAARRRMKDH